MAFLEKIFKEDMNHNNLKESISQQIKLLFYNRNDILLSYYDKTGKICSLHDFFYEKYLSNEFLNKLSNSIIVNDPRLEYVDTSIEFKNNSPVITINCKLKKGNIEVIEINLDSLY